MPRSLDEILDGEVLTPKELAQLPSTEHAALPHLPVVILLDTSDSTAQNNAIVQISDSINDFFARIINPPDEFHRKLRRQGDFSVIRYGGDVEVILPWTNGSQIQENSKLALYPNGLAPMGQAIVRCADLLLDRYRGYKAVGTRAFCGLVFNLTDGQPTDMSAQGTEEQKKMWKKAQERVQLFEEMGSSKNPYAQFIHFSTDGTAAQTLTDFAGEQALFMPSDSEMPLQRVNRLDGGDSFARFIRYIEMSLNNIMSGGEG
jgi:uncharacterized protein YegL